MNLLQTDKVIATVWYLYLDEKQKKLVKHALELYARELSLDSTLTDYSFLVFTMSKAYEGFLKKYLRDLNIISTKVYEGRRFRIGRAINPDVHPNQRDNYWLYDDITQLCGETMAFQLWDTWLKCRNRVFHYFPKDDNTLSFKEAEEYLVLIIDTIERAIECKMTLNFNNSK